MSLDDACMDQSSTLKATLPIVNDVMSGSKLLAPAYLEG